MYKRLNFLIVVYCSYAQPLFSGASEQLTDLCIEIGHTRFKAARLPRTPSFHDLKRVKTISGLSAPYLKKNLPRLFKQSCRNPIASLLHDQPKNIALSIFGPLYEGGIHACWNTTRRQKNLKIFIKRETGYSVLMQPDVAVWALGALEYLKLTSRKSHFPCLAITLGTGVGVALIEKEQKINVIEFWAMKWQFVRLQAITDVRPAYRILYHSYLSHIMSSNNESIDQQVAAYRPLFNKHFYAFVKDVSAHIQTLFSQKIESILVGGGTSRYIDLSKSDAALMTLLSPQALISDGVSPDIIQLLGCQQMLVQQNLCIDTYPSLQDILAFLNQGEC